MELNMNKSSDYTENLELDAFNWMTRLMQEDGFDKRSEYQQNFLHRQYERIYNRLYAKIAN